MEIKEEKTMSVQDIQTSHEGVELEREGVTLDNLDQRIATLEATTSGLVQLFKEKFDRDESKSKLIEMMIAQLEKYEKDFIFEKFQKRMFLDAIQLFDRIDTLKQDISTGREDFSEHLESIQTEVLQMLKRQGIELIEETSKRFNEEFQEAIGRNSTPDPEEDNNIIEVINRGFMHHDRLLRPEKVVVAKYEGGTEDD